MLFFQGNDCLFQVLLPLKEKLDVFFAPWWQHLRIASSVGDFSWFVNQEQSEQEEMNFQKETTSPGTIFFLEHI